MSNTYVAFVLMLFEHELVVEHFILGFSILKLTNGTECYCSYILSVYNKQLYIQRYKNNCYHNPTAPHFRNFLPQYTILPLHFSTIPT